MSRRKRTNAGTILGRKRNELRFGHPSGSAELFLVAKRAADYLAKDNTVSEKGIRDENLIAIVFSVLAVEGFLNDLSSFDLYVNGQPAVADRDDHLKSLRRVMVLAEDANLQSLDKLKLAHEILGKPIDSGRRPIQDYQLLKQLRDAIVHPKPSSTTIITELTSPPSSPQFHQSRKKLLQALNSRGLLATDPSRRGQGFLYWLNGRKLAQWAVETASSIITATIESLPRGDYKKGMAAMCREFFLGNETMKTKWKDIVFSDEES